MDGDTAATRSTAVRTCEKDSCDSHDSPSGNDRNLYVFKCRLYGVPFKTYKEGTIT